MACGHRRWNSWHVVDDNLRSLLERSFTVGELGYRTGPFGGWIKQLSVDQLDERSRKVLDECFPEFAGFQRVAQFYRSGGIELELTPKGTTRTDTGRLRRYAGDETLSGGRYYSVCSDASGDDGGTLVWELMSYWSAASLKFPQLVDSTVHVDAARNLRRAMPHLDRPFLMLTAHDIRRVASEGIKLGDSVAVIMPLTIQKVRIDSVVDLRLPVVQDFFADVLGRLEADFGRAGNAAYRGGGSNFTLKRAPESFAALLPTLLTPRPGGTTFHDAIGALCRNAGAAGLVFPSARRDVHVNAGDGAVRGFSGWNFVDYRNAPDVRPEVILQNLGLQMNWLRPEHVGITVDWTDDGMRRRWRVSGAEAGERRRYDLEWEVMAGSRTPSPGWTTWFAARDRLN
jgi:hypothetical protein